MGNPAACQAPLLCSACGEVGIINILGDQPDGCPSCGSSDVEVAAVVGQLFNDPPGSIGYCTIDMRKMLAAFFLPGPFVCPACGKQELMIRAVGLWD